MTTVTAATGANKSTSQTAGFTADYSMFLKLLTTQMQNQDPLDPMKTSEYTQQLVQYSQVEQAIQQTGALQNILTQLSSQQMSQASSFIGREARFDSPVAGLGTGPAIWTYQVEGTPASITGTIKNAAGKVVKTMALDPAAQGRFEWDGTVADGRRAADGAYTLSLSATSANGGGLDSSISSVARVTDVVSSGTDVMLGVNGIRMPLSSLAGVSAAD